jgi:hypothetical protein
VGPVVTLGRPGDDLAFAGAARLYVSNANWQQAIRHLMMRSIAVVILVGRTEGLWWEINTALEVVSLNRLLFCFPYIPNIPRSRSRWALWLAFTRRWNLPRKAFLEMESERNARYREFLRNTATTPTKCLQTDLGSSCFIDFSPDGRARLLEIRTHRFHLRDLNPLSVLQGMLHQTFFSFLMPGHYRYVGFDMEETLRPFFAKPH